MENIKTSYIKPVLLIGKFCGTAPFSIFERKCSKSDINMFLFQLTFVSIYVCYYLRGELLYFYENIWYFSSMNLSAIFLMGINYCHVIAMLVAMLSSFIYRRCFLEIFTLFENLLVQESTLKLQCFVCILLFWNYVFHALYLFESYLEGDELTLYDNLSFFVFTSYENMIFLIFITFNYILLQFTKTLLKRKVNDVLHTYQIFTDIKLKINVLCNYFIIKIFLGFLTLTEAAFNIVLVVNSDLLDFLYDIILICSKNITSIITLVVFCEITSFQVC